MSKNSIFTQLFLKKQVNFNCFPRRNHQLPSNKNIAFLAFNCRLINAQLLKETNTGRLQLSTNVTILSLWRSWIRQPTSCWFVTVHETLINRVKSGSTTSLLANPGFTSLVTCACISLVEQCQIKLSAWLILKKLSVKGSVEHYQLGGHPVNKLRLFVLRIFESLEFEYFLTLTSR